MSTPAADVTLTIEIVDRIEELVAPGVTLNADDNSYGTAELRPAALLRKTLLGTVTAPVDEHLATPH